MVRKILILCILLSVLAVPAVGVSTHTPDYTFVPQHNLTDKNDSQETTEPVKEMSYQKEKDYSQQDLGAGMVQKGIDLFVLSVADDLNSIWKDNTVSRNLDENQEITDEYGATRGTLFTFITYNPEPNKIAPIQEFVNGSKEEWVFLVSMYILGFLFAARIERMKGKYFAKALSSTDLSENRFIIGAIVCMLSYLCPRLVLLSLDLCTAISQYFMLQSIDYIEPSVENVTMYFFMGVGEFSVAAFFVIRQWYIDMFYVVSHFMPVLYMMGIFKYEIEWAVQKYKKILTMQPFCILIASVIIIAIKERGMEGLSSIYVIMFFMLAYLLKQWVFGGYLDNTIKGILKRAAYTV